MPFSGVNGKVYIGSTAVADVTRWHADHVVANTSVVASTSGGWHLSFVGARKITGGFEAKLKNSGNNIVPGAYVQLKLDTGGGVYLIGQALLTQCSYEVNVDTGAAVTVRAEFVSNGAWTLWL